MNAIRKRVLVVDDEADIRDYFKAVLEDRPGGPAGASGAPDLTCFDIITVA